MSRLRLQRHEVRGLDVTALIDIVIILISFFIFFNNSADLDQNQRIRLPKSEIAIPSKVLPATPLTVQILEDGSLLFNNIEYDPAKFADALGFECRLFQRQNVAADEITVLLRGDGLCEGGKVMDIVRECQRNGICHYRFIAKSEKNTVQ